MIDAIIGLAVIIAGLFGAFFFGKRKERKANDTKAENTRIATEGRIKGAIRDADSDPAWRDQLRDR